MIVIVAAVARNGVIGRENALPWHLPEDLAHFKALTTGHAVLMGRKTWESLPAKFRPLPNRRNYVLTRDPYYVAPGATVLHSLEEAMKLGAGETALFVIGGAELYAHSLPFADRLELTEIDLDAEGDAHFPGFDRDAWREVRRVPGVSANGLAYAFVTYERA
ncbi:MAG: dihydrofolate reductase [Rhodocyclaceae bacterium]|jgi:dihydrofolate reductase|nr:dihydrofolate reductase [Rhodocyclaceae bacterium]